MAEQDLLRFLDKVSQLQNLVASIDRDNDRRQQLARCSDHNQVVALARSWGFEIGRRWGEPTLPTICSDNLFGSPLPALGEESERVLQSGESWCLKLIVSNQFKSPDGFWYDQDEDEWLLLLKGSARLRLENPEQIIDLSAGDHLYLPSRRRHRIERTDPQPGTVWIALYWSSIPSVESTV